MLKNDLEAEDILIFFYNFSKEIRSDISCELSARQTIHMKCKTLFPWKNREKVRKIKQKLE